MAESDQITIVGSDACIKGEMTFERTARIVGKFEGTINAKGELQIGEGGDCKASVDAQSVSIDGSLVGDVRAGQIIHLNAKANMRGDLTATKLVVAEGASLVGHVAVGADALKKSARSDGPAARTPETAAASAR